VPVRSEMAGIAGLGLLDTGDPRAWDRRGRLSSGSLGADRPGGPERCGRYALFDSPTRRTGRAR